MPQEKVEGLSAKMQAKSASEAMAKASEITKRTTITLPASVFEGLEQWAEREGRATASLAAFLVEACVRSKFPGDFSPQLSVNLSPTEKEGDRNAD